MASAWNQGHNVLILIRDILPKTNPTFKPISLTKKIEVKGERKWLRAQVDVIWEDLDFLKHGLKHDLNLDRYFSTPPKKSIVDINREYKDSPVVVYYVALFLPCEGGSLSCLFYESLEVLKLIFLKVGQDLKNKGEYLNITIL